MTSGNFAQVSVESIYVERTERQRKELVNIEELAASIQRVGLIHPPIIERDGKLRTGERRWTAVKSLGWTHISVQYVDELDEIELQLLELEENIQRVNLPWADECLAVARYHSLHVARDPTWTQIQSAEMLGVNNSLISMKLSVAKELVAGNKRVIEAPKFSVARGVVARTNERAASSAIAQALAMVAPEGEKPVERTVPMENVSFIDWAKTYSGPLFNMIHCDFPYGVNADKHDQGQAAALGGYDDSFSVYEELLLSMKTAMLDGKVVDQSAHLMFWFSMDYYQFTFDALQECGWKINPFPLIWYKNDNTGILPDSNRGPRRGYETAFFGYRGDRKLTARGAVNNVFAHPGRDKSIHMSEKPVPMLKHFMGMVVDEYSRVLDPTAGSGNALKAATALGANQVLGLELSTEFYNRAKEAYYGDEE